MHFTSQFIIYSQFYPEVFSLVFQPIIYQILHLFFKSKTRPLFYFFSKARGVIKFGAQPLGEADGKRNEVNEMTTDEERSLRMLSRIAILFIKVVSCFPLSFIKNPDQEKLLERKKGFVYV